MWVYSACALYPTQVCCTLTIRCRWEDKTARETTGRTLFHTEARKMNFLTEYDVISVDDKGELLQVERES